MKRICLISLLCGFFILAPLALFSPAQAKNQASIVDLQVRKETENLQVSFRLQDCFTPKMEEAIRSGVATSFRILVVVEKPEGIGPLRQKVVDLTLERTIKYDSLKAEYRIDLPDHPDGTFVTGDFDEARRRMSTVQDLSVVPLWRLQKKEPYQLRVKAELSKVRLPLFLRYIFFFVSLWDFETNWEKVSFSY